MKKQSLFSVDSMGRAIFPEGITSIPDKAFSFNENLVEVVVPEGVVSIGNNAFEHCEKLQSVKLPSSLKSIGDEAFFFCLKLSLIKIPSSVTSIGRMAFRSCFSIKEIFIPENVSKIGEGFLVGCYDLQHITVSPQNHTFSSVGDCLLCCGGQSLHTGCCNSVPPVGILEIGSYAFSGIHIREIKIPEGTEVIGFSAFGFCYGLEKVSLPSSLLLIRDEAFRMCSRLEKIDLPQGVLSVGKRAFHQCRLREMTLPGGNFTIGPGAFAAACAPEGLHLSLDNTAYRIEGGFILSKDGRVLYGCVALTLPMPEVEVIRRGAFDGVPFRGGDIVLPDSVTVIGDGAFSGRSAIGKVEIPSSVKKVGSRIFGERSVEELVFHGIPQEVKENSFDCRGIGKVTFPGGMIPVDFLKNVSRNIASVEENPDKILIMGTSGDKITLTFPEGTIEE